MKRITYIVIGILCTLQLSGCVQNKQVQTDGLNNNFTTEDNPQSVTEDLTVQETTQNADEDETKDVDFDLTQMGSDMVYATVFQMMTNPEDYEGKTIRVQGRFYSSWYDATSKYYHYVVVQDAMACCAQGIEFVWEDGQHIYPDDYPEENATIEVTGTFETYQEDGDENLYNRLNHAQVVEKQKVQ